MASFHPARGGGRMITGDISRHDACQLIARARRRHESDLSDGNSQRHADTNSDDIQNPLPDRLSLQVLAPPIISRHF
jgi:hypothetical protein